jgi:hypothetical protein
MECSTESFVAELAKGTEHPAGPVPRGRRRKRRQVSDFALAKTDAGERIKSETDSITPTEENNAFGEKTSDVDPEFEDRFQ